MFVTQNFIRDVYADIWSCWAFLSCIIVPRHIRIEKGICSSGPKEVTCSPVKDPQKVLVILQIKIWLWPISVLINTPYCLLSKSWKVVLIQRCKDLEIRFRKSRRCAVCSSTADSTKHHLWLCLLSLCVCLLNYCTIFSESWQSGHRFCTIFSEIVTIRT